MSLLVFVAVAFGGAALAVALRSRPALATAIGLVSLLVVTIVALRLDPDERFLVAGGGLVTSQYVVLFLDPGFSRRARAGAGRDRRAGRAVMRLR